MTESLVVSDLKFDVRRSEKRTTIGITVERSGELTLIAPLECAWADIVRAAEDKQFWVHSKFAEKHLMSHPVTSKEYVRGEGFYYLGRTYRLLLTEDEPCDSSIPPLRLYQGRFILRRDQRASGKEHFIHWYIDHGHIWLQRRVNSLANRMGTEAHAINVRDLGYRWGSCGQSNSLNFHWRTMLLPPSIGEYIVAHELAHLVEPSHGGNFWKRLERTMPDSGARKRWLAHNGAVFAL